MTASRAWSGYGRLFGVAILAFMAAVIMIPPAGGLSQVPVTRGVTWPPVAPRPRGPSPMQMIIPPMANLPRALRGTQVIVKFIVDTAGGVSSLSVTPPIHDTVYAKTLDRVLRSYRFRPAVDSAGQPVEGAMQLTLTF